MRGALQMCQREKKNKRQWSVSCCQTWGPQRSQKETKKEKQNWFYGWALSTLTGSFELDRLIVVFGMTTKKWNVYGHHRRINGRHHMLACAWKCMRVCVCGRTYGCTWLRPVEQLSLLQLNFKICHNLLSRHDVCWLRWRVERLCWPWGFWMQTRETVCNIFVCCFVSLAASLSLILISFLHFIHLLYFLFFLTSVSFLHCTPSLSILRLLVQGDCRTREEALILGVELCDNGFMHHGTAVFTTEDLNKGKKKKDQIVPCTNRGILSITD